MDVPPIRNVVPSEKDPGASLTRLQTESPAPNAASPKPPSQSSMSKVDSDVYIADGDYIRDIEVNDLRNRYTLTKGSTQKMVNIP